MHSTVHILSTLDSCSIPVRKEMNVPLEKVRAYCSNIYNVTKNPVKKTVCSKEFPFKIEMGCHIHSSDNHQAVIRQSSSSHQADTSSHPYTLNIEWPWITLYTILNNSNLEIHWNLEVTLFFEKTSPSVHKYKPHKVRFWAAQFFSGTKNRVSRGLAVQNISFIWCKSVHIGRL